MGVASDSGCGTLLSMFAVLQPATIQAVPQSSADSLSQLSMVIALLAVIVGPAVSLWITFRQLRSARSIANEQFASERAIARDQLISPLREKWNAELRNDVAEFISLCIHCVNVGYRVTADDYKTLNFLIAKVTLLLNADEEPHNLFRKQMLQLEDAVRALQRAESDGAFVEAKKKFDLCCEELLRLARNIMKGVWERVKAGELAASAT